MTTDSLAGALGVAEILAGCDRLLGEIGRRQHLFGWLRNPGAGPGEWLPVDAYYPANRLVVQCSRSPYDSLYAELVPAHGLRLLRISPAELAGGDEGISAALERMLASLAPVVRSSGTVPSEVHPHESVVARAFVSATQPSGRHRGAARRRPEAEIPGQFVATGMLVGIALVVALCIEIYVGITQLALGGGHIALAFGIALDACSRVLGTVGAHRANEDGWLWPCVIVGSPVVAAFALFRSSGPVDVDPAPLAGLLAVLAIALIALALVAMVLGI